jgi:hypothetical protein
MTVQDVYVQLSGGNGSRTFGPLTIPGYANMTWNFTIAYSRFINVTVTQSSSTIDGWHFDFEPPPVSVGDECLMAFILPFTASSCLLYYRRSSRKRGGSG